LPANSDGDYSFIEAEVFVGGQPEDSARFLN